MYLFVIEPFKNAKLIVCLSERKEIFFASAPNGPA